MTIDEISKTAIKEVIDLKIKNKVDLIKFGSSQEEYESLLSEGYVKLDVVGRCKRNEWNGWITPQILIEEYQITGQSKYVF